MSDKKLSIVIPTYNGSKTICQTIDSILLASKNIGQIIVVDDCSEDLTLDIIKNYIKDNNLSHIIELVPLSENVGPAFARKEGFKRVTKDYTIFFDGDDIMLPNVLDPTLERMIDERIEVAIFEYDIYDGRRHYGMWPKDRERFQRLMLKGEVLNAVEARESVLLTNYPWNKICSTEYLNRINIDFGHFRLHEDVLLHWQILMSTRSVLFVDKALCRYSLPMGATNMTNDKSDKRLQCLDVLEWLKYYVWNHENCENFKWEYLDFVCILTGWAINNIDAKYKPTFRHRLKELFLSIPMSLIIKSSYNNETLQYIYNALKRE